MRIYLAGPLFTEAERAWMLELKNRVIGTTVRSGFDADVTWPWELFSPSEIEQLADLAGHEIFNRCKTALDQTDILIALLDGPMVDDGTAWEIGYFFAFHRACPIIGIRTDLRNAGETPGARANAMIEYSCTHIAHTQDTLIEYLDKFLRGQPSPKFP